jgi:uncharacterized oxidoreductase
MKLKDNTILITGGGTGIGLALAEILSETGNQVLICGRRVEKLEEARHRLPGIDFMQCDLTHSEDRQALFNWATQNYPGLNVLVNNAGIQRQIDLTQGEAELLEGEDEVEINLCAPILLSAMFVPHLMKQETAAIVNVSSGLGFIPIAFMPVYSATKAALHSFSLSLRHQLRNSSVKVFEIIPPTVDTELDKGARGRRGQADRGIPSVEVAQAALQALAADDYELAVGRAEGLRMAARSDPETYFRRMNGE